MSKTDLLAVAETVFLAGEDKPRVKAAFTEVIRPDRCQRMRQEICVIVRDRITWLRAAGPEHFDRHSPYAHFNTAFNGARVEMRSAPLIEKSPDSFGPRLKSAEEVMACPFEVRGTDGYYDALLFMEDGGCIITQQYIFTEEADTPEELAQKLSSMVKNQERAGWEFVAVKPGHRIPVLVFTKNLDS